MDKQRLQQLAGILTESSAPSGLDSVIHKIAKKSGEIIWHDRMGGGHGQTGINLDDAAYILSISFDENEDMIKNKLVFLQTKYHDEAHSNHLKGIKGYR